MAVAGGTGSSNPLSSSGESPANLTIYQHAHFVPGAVVRSGPARGRMIRDPSTPGNSNLKRRPNVTRVGAPPGICV
jgi:hypothetical protein